MEKKQHIGNRQVKQAQIEEQPVRNPELAEWMNHPNQCPEEESFAFWNSLENREACRYVLLARMAHTRRKTPSPNVEQAWDSFRKSNIEKPAPRRKALSWHMWGAALAGAAAMWVLIFLYDYFRQDDQALKTGMGSMVAMTYDDNPQHITLWDDEQVIDLSQKDSLSFKESVEEELLPTPPPLTTESKTAPRMQKLSTPRGMDFKVILPDGSEVWLNAESTIEFPTSFLGNDRQVILKGEAYFKVARNENSPFVVISDRMKVRVLGTEFNFKNYTEETSHVSLVKGTVEVSCIDSEQSSVTLKPGQDAWWNETGEIHVREVDTYAVTQWVDGFFYFDNTPLVEVLRELGRWYNLGVVFRNAAGMHYKMHFSASRDEEIGQALENLNRLRKVRVGIEGKNIVVY